MLCADKHYTKEHICQICNAKEVACIHTELKCSNCQEKHAANDNSCVFCPRKDTQKNLKRKYSKSELAVVISTRKSQC